MIEAFIDFLDSHYSMKKVSGGSQVQLSGSPCPFCGDSRSDLRLYVNVKTGLGICWHCSQGFSPASFVASFENCSWHKAKALLEGREEGYVTTEDEVVVAADEGAIWPAGIPIQESESASAYLLGRGIDALLWAHFGLYYAPGNVEIGEKTYYTNRRVIIPIKDRAGQFISWQARDITGKAKLRYLFPPGFKGAEHLFNSCDILPGSDYLIVCEGMFDAFGWWRAGFKNVVATFGKKISDGQLDILLTLRPGKVFIAWDSDAAWGKAEFCEKFSHLFPAVRIVDLAGKDADELSAKDLAVALSNARCYNWEEKIMAALA